MILPMLQPLFKARGIYGFPLQCFLFRCAWYVEIGEVDPKILVSNSMFHVLLLTASQLQG